MSISIGSFVWCELQTIDPQAAKKFYLDVVGWESHDRGAEGISPTEFSTGKTAIAGMAEITLPALDGDAKPGWIGYIAVDDVDGLVADITKAGGKLRRAAEDVSKLGRLAIVTDPQGAEFAVLKPALASNLPERVIGRRGHVGWHQLNAENWEAAFDFYAALFGWTKSQAVDGGPLGIYQIFSYGDTPVGGVTTKLKTMPVPFWLYYFNVENINEAAARVKDGGGAVLMGPVQVFGGNWVVQCVDPQGTTFALAAPH